MAEADERSARRLSPGLVVAGLLVVAVVVFVVQNTRTVRVEWLVFELEWPLWLTLLVTAGLAIIAGELIGRAIRHHRRD